MNSTDIDLLDLDVFARRVPHDWFTFLRRHAPVYKHPEPDGPGFWVITKHADVRRIERDEWTFSSSASRGGVVALASAGAADGSLERPRASDGGSIMLEMDPPEHTSYRNVATAPFRRRAIAALERRIQAHTAQILDRALTLGEFDFVSEVAMELPAQTIAGMLGMSIEDRSKIVDWSNRLGDDPEYASEDGRGEVEDELFAYARDLFDERRRRPADDILSSLVRAEIDGERISEVQSILYFELLAVAGESTSRTALSQGLIAFIEHPDEYARLVEDPSLIDTAVEEILRWAPPALYFRRNVTRDTEIRGIEIPAGDKVSIWYVSANRDEDVFDDPFSFDIARHPNEHISFGEGRHTCLGIHLARLELKVFFAELAKRVRTISQAGAISRLRSNLEHGIKRLPVRFEGIRGGNGHA